MPPRAFGRCESCTHAAMGREGAACLLCGGRTQPADPPADLFAGWRCRCYHCVSTPC